MKISENENAALKAAFSYLSVTNEVCHHVFRQLSLNRRNRKPPAMRVEDKKVIQLHHLSFVYNEGVQAIIKRKER